jgi:hypothetical protein
MGQRNYSRKYRALSFAGAKMHLPYGPQFNNDQSENRLKRDQLVFLIQSSGILAKHAHNIARCHRAAFVVTIRQPAFNLRVFADGFCQKKYFLPNEPKVVQCLRGVLKKANPKRTQIKPIFDPFKANRTQTLTRSSLITHHSPFHRFTYFMLQLINPSTVQPVAEI